MNKSGEDLEDGQDENRLIFVNDPTDQHTFLLERGDGILLIHLT